MTNELTFFLVGLVFGILAMFWIPSRWLDRARAYLAEQHHPRPKKPRPEDFR